MLKKLIVSLALTASLVAHSSPELKCLADAVHYEARGEPYLGKLAVATVVINRTKHPDYPNTICKVVNQYGQFPWARKKRRGVADYTSFNVAHIALTGEHQLSDFNAIYFNHKKVKPIKGTVKVRTIGNHTFYKEK